MNEILDAVIAKFGHKSFSVSFLTEGYPDGTENVVACLSIENGPEYVSPSFADQTTAISAMVQHLTNTGA